MKKTWIFLLILVLSYSYGMPCGAEYSHGSPLWKYEKRTSLTDHINHARRRAEQARDAAADAERAAASCDWGRFWKAWEEAERRLASARKYRDKAEAIEKELSGAGVHYVEGYSGTREATNKLIYSAEEALSRAASRMALCRKPLWRALWEGLLDLTVTGVGTTTGLSVAMTNKTDTAMEVVIPTGTQLTTTAKGFQPYQTGYNPPIALGPRETVTKEIVAFCTDNSLAPAPKDDPSVTYTVSESPPTPQQEKITELIVTTNSLRQFYSNIGPVAEPDDFIGPPPEKPEPEVYGPPPPPKPRTPEEEAWREQQKKELDEWVKKEMEKMKKYGPPPPPEKPEPEEYGPPPPPEKPEPEVYGPPPPLKPGELDDLLQQLQRARAKHLRDRDWTSYEHGLMDVLEWVVSFGFGLQPPSAPKEWDEDEDFGGIPEPPPGPPEPAPPEGFEVPPGSIVLPPNVILLSLSGPLEFPGTAEFTLSPEVPELKTMISAKDEKGEAVFSNPTGKVGVSLEPTEDPDIVGFNITKLEARAESLEALGKERGDINIALNSPEKSTGLLNIETGEVRGTVSVKAWGKEYKEPFPAAATYTGKFDVTTRKLSLNLRGTSFEPVEIPQGPYEKANPEKFWESVQLYTIWRETNKIGKEELSKLTEEQFREKYPAQKARKLGEQVAEEIIGRVDKVYESHEELKEEGIDFSVLDPTLKWRKT